MPMSISLYK